MSERLDSLIRLHRRQVDERRRQVAELVELAVRLRLELARLAEEPAAEPAAGGNLITRHVYPGTIRRARDRQKTLEQSLAETERQSTQARAALAMASLELQRHEIAQAARDRLRLHAAARRDRIETGAVPIENYRRVGAR